MSVWVSLGVLAVVFVAESAWISGLGDTEPPANVTAEGSGAKAPPTSIAPAPAVPGTSPSSTGPDSTTGHVAPPATRGALAARLAGLVVAPAGSGAGYRQDLFPAWTDADSDGCDTRCEVLGRQRRTDLAGLGGGGWLSVYDGHTTSGASELDVDHVVALAEAWVSGADRSDTPTRTAFANDLGSPQLVAVTAASNRSKSSHDPARWQPPERGSWCGYADAWVTVKTAWRLTADQPEVDGLARMLTAAACP